MFCENARARTHVLIVGRYYSSLKICQNPAYVNVAQVIVYKNVYVHKKSA
jgi:hypothetical protein